MTGKKVLEILRKSSNELKDKTFSPTELEEIFKVSKYLGVSGEVGRKLSEAGIHSEIFEFDRDIRQKKIERYIDFIRFLKRNMGDDFILLKGLSFAQKYYGDPTGRDIGDIDILVREKDTGKFIAFFREIGFSKFPQSEIRKMFEHVKQFGGEFKGDTVYVGLHISATNLLFSRIMYEDVEYEETEIKLGRRSVRVRTMQPEWELIHAVLHLFPHAFALRIFLDVHKILISGKADIKKAEEISKEMKNHDAVVFGILGAKKIFLRDNLFGRKIVENEEAIKKWRKPFLEFITSEFYFFRARELFTKIPYFDTVFSLAVFGRIPWKLILRITPLLPTEFIRRLKGIYPVAK